jgi:chorismate mutase/prephenate dehydrogenase
MDRLETLRRRIRHLDAALLALVAERTELAREIGGEKRRAGIPLRDYEVEKRVLDRAEATAGELGLDRETAKALVGHLIDEACRVQEVDHATAYAGDAESVLVVGGAGRMGRWLVAFLESQGHRVRVLDPAAASAERSTVATLADGLDGASLVFVATPLERVAESLDAITDLGFGGVVCDLASLKTHLSPALERARERGVAVTSIHPMFGPSIRTLSGRVIVLCDCGDAAATARVARLFRDTAATLVPLSLERHDQIAGFVLGLSHLVNLLFARVLAASGEPLGELAAVGSTTFRAQLDLAAAVARESPELYYGIQKLNPFTPRVHELVRGALSELADWIAANEPGRFAAAMREAGERLGAAVAREGGPGPNGRMTS